MKKYRKKPIVIEALHFKDKQEAIDFTGKDDVDRDILIRTYYCPPGEGIAGLEYLYGIRTLEGDMSLKKGDYIIKGIKGEFYPCKEEIFNKLYDEVKL